MKIVSRALVPLLLIAALPVAGALAESALAETATDGHHHSNPEMRSRMEDGRLAFAKAALKLTDAQSRLWAPLEDLIRKSDAEGATHWQDAHAHRGEIGVEREKGGREEPGSQEGHGDRAEIALPDRLDKSSARMIERAEKAKAFSAALRPLYDSFSPEQRVIAGKVLAGLIGGQGGDGRHGGHHQGGGHGWKHDRARGEHGGGERGGQGNPGERDAAPAPNKG